MRKMLIIAMAILVLLTIVFLVAEDQKAQAAANYVWWLPIVHNNYNPSRYGCQPPDGAPCRGDPPFSVIP